MVLAEGLRPLIDNARSEKSDLERVLGFFLPFFARSVLVVGLQSLKFFTNFN